MKPLYILLSFCRRRLFDLLLFLVIMLITSPTFKQLYIMKFRDIIYYLNCVLMFKFYHNLLSSAFHYFFTPIASRHKYNTRLSSKSAFCIPTARTNYGKFNIRFKGAVLWNNIEASLKIIRFHKFKCCLKKSLIVSY